MAVHLPYKHGHAWAPPGSTPPTSDRGKKKKKRKEGIKGEEGWVMVVVFSGGEQEIRKLEKRRSESVGFGKESARANGVTS